jgi:hypothetical protein
MPYAIHVDNGRTITLLQLLSFLHTHNKADPVEQPPTWDAQSRRWEGDMEHNSLNAHDIAVHPCLQTIIYHLVKHLLPAKLCTQP